MRDPFSVSRQHLLRTALVVAVGLAALTQGVRAQESTLDAAAAVYDAAEYGQAIDLLHEVAYDTNVNVATQQEALLYLARAYTAERLHDEARRTLDHLLTLEPPPVTVNPEIEHPHLVKLYYQARHDHQGYDVERPDPGLQTIAVMDFDNNSVHDRVLYDPLEKGLASLMGHYLGGATQLQVVERDRVHWLLEELELQRDTTLVDQERAVRMGKVLGVHVVLFGSYAVHEGRIRIGARLVKVETSEVILSEHLFGEPDDFFELIERLSLQVAQAINVELDRDDVRERRATSGYDALLAYSDGVVLVEQGRYAEAHAKFMQALEHDPGYEQARQRAASLGPLVAEAR